MTARGREGSILLVTSQGPWYILCFVTYSKGTKDVSAYRRSNRKTSYRFTMYIAYTLKNNFELIQSICSMWNLYFVKFKGKKWCWNDANTRKLLPRDYRKTIAKYHCMNLILQLVSITETLHLRNYYRCYHVFVIIMRKNLLYL